jgi:phosphatidylglycerol:prolipoprotein diacylglycerol transferase
VIPYVPHPTIEIGGHELGAFRVLVLGAVLTQFWMVVRLAPRFGVDVRRAGNLCIWAIGLGLASAHVFDVITYFPERLAEDPLALLRFWGSLSSTGGMLGGLLGLLIVMRVQRFAPAEIWSFFDLCLYALPFTLAVGRLGCALQHDHLGRASDHLLAVAFPDGPRFDLGLLEFLAVSAISALFLALIRRPRPPGFFVGAFFVLYGPTRFVLDALRTDDARYFGWTPAQGLMVLAMVVGVAILTRIRRSPDSTPS